MDLNTQRSKLYAQLQGQLIVSVQAPDSHAMRGCCCKVGPGSKSPTSRH
ncbi:putative N-acetylmannosamine-6-phosphate 2-epimerase [Corynebacterium glutamicum]|nr:putative N-acetylmannosamine-6-phosphate 2-epimerase [Corynebacterium glutamicum]